MTPNGNGNGAGLRVKLRRRSFLLGAGAAAVVPPVQAEDNLRLSFPDDARRDSVVIRYGAEDTTWHAALFGEDAWFTLIRHSAPRHVNAVVGGENPHGESLDWLANRWQLTVEQGRFPGGGPHTLVFHFERAAGTTSSDPFRPWTVRLETVSWPQGARPTRFGPTALDGFLCDGPWLRTSLAAKPAQQMLEGWFGKRIETIDMVGLELDRSLHWRVTSAKQQIFILDLATPTTSSPFGFSELRVERTFADGQAPGQAGKAGAGEERLFAEFTPRRLPANRPEIPPPGLYGTLLGPAKLEGTAKGSFEFGITEGKAGVRAVLTLSDIECMQAALRQWGDAAQTVAGVRLDSGINTKTRATLTIEAAQKGGTLRDARFEASGFQLVRQLVPDPERAREMMDQSTALLTPRAKEHILETPFGPLEIRAAAPVPPATGKIARVPPIELTAVDRPGPPARRVLRRFDAVVSLVSVGVRLPALTPVAGALPRPDDEPVARLEFEDAECRFVLPAVGPHYDTISADAVVALGPDPGPAGGGATEPLRHAMLDLGRARLTLLRPSDLLSLRYRFSGLLLLLPRRGDAALGRMLPNRGGPVCRGGSPADTHPVRDLRPIMVVEFPPQHVAERAYFRRIDTPVLPVLVPTEAQQDMLAHLRSLRRPRGQDAAGTAREARIKLRSDLKKSKLGFDPKTSDTFVAEFERRAARSGGKKRALPVEQRVYLGPEFLDAGARRLALDVLRESAPESSGSITALTLPQAAMEEALAPFGLVPPGSKAEGAKFDLFNCDHRAAAEAVELAKERLSSDYAEFRHGFGTVADASCGNLPRLGMPASPCCGPAPSLGAAADACCGKLTYLGEVWYAAVKPLLPKALTDFVAGYDAARQEAFETLTEARLSGPSRLAFRINCDDFQAERAGGGFPFSLEGLTEWGSMDLSVVRRAERLVKQPERGPRAPRWAQVYDLDDGAVLEHMGLTRGDHIAVETDRAARRGGPPAGGKPAYRLQASRVDASQRLAEVVESARAAPDQFQTAIELPFRLMLSPAQDAAWRVPNAAVRNKAFSIAGGAMPLDPYRELWSATLAGSGALAGVRAVWSPDFRPEALLSTRSPGAPPHGPWAPWSLPRSFGLRTPPSGDALGSMRKFRTAMDAYDRHEIVVLSSVHGLPVLGRRERDGALIGGSQFEPPDGFALAGLEKNALPVPKDEPGALLPARDYSAIYRPQPLLVNELALTALGGNLDHDTAFVPPASARLEPAAKEGRAVNLFDALSIERWRNRTVLGRDILVEVVYKGFLFPIGHKAALVKLTERRFEASPDGGAPIAVLIQREFLRVGRPEKRFPAYGQPNEARRWPAQRVELLTRRTPDLVAHDDVTGGLIALSGTGLAFWPRTAPWAGAEVKFEMRIDDEGGSGAMPLIFVDHIAVHDQATMTALVDYYRREVDPAMRRLPRNGQGVRMAPAAKTGDTTYVTDWWELLAEGRTSTSPANPVPGPSFTLDNSAYDIDPFMEGLDQPGFYPLVDVARCRLTQVERMTGRQTVWSRVGFDGYYVTRGFVPDGSSPADETFLRIVGDAVPMAMADGERSGGIGQPNTNVVGLSRAIGPIGTSDEKAKGEDGTLPGKVPSISGHSHTLDRGKLFPPNAKLLGLVQLSEVLKVAAALADQPTLKETTDYGASAVAGAGAAARGYIAEYVLHPMQAAVQLLFTQWQTLGESNPELQGVDLEAAYPQIGQALQALSSNLERSLSTRPVLPDTEFFLLLADIYEGGQTLVAVIEEVLRDPVASLSEAQGAGLRTLIHAVRQVAELLSDPQAALRKAFEEASRQVIGELLRDAPWRRLFFALPSPGGTVPIDDPAALAFDTACRNALDSALTQAIEKGGLAALGTDFRAAFRQEGGTAAFEALRDEAVARVDQATLGAARPLLEYLATPRLLEVEDAIGTILRASKAAREQLGNPTAANLAAFASGVSQILEAASILLGRPIALTGVLDYCGALTTLPGAVANLAGLLVPIDDANPVPAKDLATLGETLRTLATNPGAASFSAAPIPGAGSVIRLDETATSAEDLVIALRAVEDRFVATPGEVARLKATSAAVARGASRLAFALSRVLQEISAAQEWAGRPLAGCQVPSRLLSMIVTLTAQRNEALNALHDLLGELQTLPGQLNTLAAVLTNGSFAANWIKAAETEVLQAAEAIRTTVLGGMRLYQAATLLATQVKAAGGIDGSTSDRSGYLKGVQQGLDGVAAALPTGPAKQAVQDASKLLKDSAAGLQKLENTVLARAAEMRGLAFSRVDDALRQLDDAMTRVVTLRNELETTLRAALEQALVQLVLRLGPSVVVPLQNGVTGASAPLIAALGKAYGLIADGRDGLKKAIAGDQTGGGGLLATWLRVLRSRLGEKLFTVPCDLGPGAAPGCEDRLDYERGLVTAASAAAQGNDLAGMVASLRALGGVWQTPGPAAVALARQLAAVNAEFARTVLLSAIDLRALRREVESRIRDLIPSRVVLRYDLDNELDHFPSNDPIFVPGTGTKLQLNAKTVINLLPDDSGRFKPPELAVAGALGPFAVSLLGQRFDVVTLFFDGLSFKSGTGMSPDFQVRFRDVKIGEKAKFLEDLQSYLSPKGGGFFLKFLKGGSPGIEAGYGINLGVIGVGTLSFSNVILNASVRLPFDNADARFVISIGRSDAPFLISSTIFGGGGYLALIANTKGFVGFEASFDYGGVLAFGFGPLQGIGRLTMGIYLRKEGRQTSLGAIFFAGGAAHIACFGLSTSLMVRLVQDNGGPMYGTASYTFSFSLGLKDVDFEVQVVKNEGQTMGNSSQSAAAVPSLSAPRTMLAAGDTGVTSDAGPAVRVPAAGDAVPQAKVKGVPQAKIKGVSQDEDWKKYRRYFDLRLRPAERWSPL